jgi:hypothetical protein
MTEDTFQELLRLHMHREPFLPFIVKLMNGERIVVAKPEIAFGGPAAAYLTEDDIMFFNCDEVQSIDSVTAEARS